MLPSLRYSRRTSVVSDHSLDAEPWSPYLHWLFGESGENSESDIYSRLVDDESDDVDDGTGYSKADAVIMKEVVAWLELREHDEFWVSKRNHAGRVPPTTSQLLAQLKESDNLQPCTPSGTKGFDALIQAITLQLLASCYTILPASSANHTSLFQQRTGQKLVTALRAHSLYRLSPAAGHHARASSETSAWPDLYTGPCPEDELAETVSQQRRSAKRSSEYVPSFTTNEWTDGLNDHYSQRRRSLSSSSFETGIFTRLICQPSTPRNPHRKHNALFTRTLLCKNKKEGDSSDRPPRKKPSRKVTLQAAQRIPSVMRLRHTQSNPRMQENANPEHPTSHASPKLIRRTSSDPSIGSKFRYNFEIPVIRRTSVTPNVSNKAQSSISMRDVGRGDMMSAHEYLEETQVARRPLDVTAIGKLPLIPSWIGGPPPMSGSELVDDNGHKVDGGYLNMASPALLQGDKGREADTDDDHPRFSSPNYSDRSTESRRARDRRAENDRQLHFDDNGQTATDRQNDVEFGTETGHNSQEQAKPTHNLGDTTKDDHVNVTGPNVYPTPDNRIHDRLARDTSGMYDDDDGPDPNSDPRLMKTMARQHDSSDDDTSTSESSNGGKTVVGSVRRDRRRASIRHEAGGFDSELAEKFRPVMEDLVREKECSKELEGTEVR